jgi:hypothetical protein
MSSAVLPAARTRAPGLQEYVFPLGVVRHGESPGRLQCGFSRKLAWPDTNAFARFGSLHSHFQGQRVHFRTLWGNSVQHRSWSGGQSQDLRDGSLRLSEDTSGDRWNLRRRDDEYVLLRSCDSRIHRTPEPRLAFNRTVVTRNRIAIEQHPYAPSPSTMNLRLAAIRRLAYEASDCGLLSLANCGKFLSAM